MRDSYHINVVRNESGDAWAIFLRADYIAQHEHGISQLLGEVADADAQGVERYRVVGSRCTPEDGNFQIERGFVYGWRAGRKSKLRATLLYGVRPVTGPTYVREIADRDKPLNGAWSHDNFVLMARDKEMASVLEGFASSAANGECFLYQGMNLIDPYQGGGLMLIKEVSAPKEVLTKLATGDVE